MLAPVQDGKEVAEAPKDVQKRGLRHHSEQIREAGVQAAVRREDEHE